MIDSRNIPQDFHSVVVNFRDAKRAIFLFPFSVTLKWSGCLQVTGISWGLGLVATGCVPAISLPKNADPDLFNCNSAWNLSNVLSQFSVPQSVDLFYWLWVNSPDTVGKEGKSLENGEFCPWFNGLKGCIKVLLAGVKIFCWPWMFFSFTHRCELGGRLQQQAFKDKSMVKINIKLNARFCP